MVETGDGVHLLDVGLRRARDRCPSRRRRAIVSPSVRTTPVSTRPSLSVDGVRQVVGVDGEARLRDVAQHRGVVAVDEVRQVGADGAAVAVDRVALRAAGLVAEELAAAGPAAAFELRRARRRDRLASCLPLASAHGTNDAAQRQRPRALVFVRGPADVRATARRRRS